MGGGIYLIQENDKLVEMTEQAYDSEDQLQELLETYPNLLAGDQIDRATPRRWLLISRDSVGLNEEDSSQRWSLDHLFIDQDGIPTLVEIRQIYNNGENRQKIIGEIIDYAANLVVYWPIDSIVSLFETNCRELGRDPEQVFAEFLGIEANEDRFWQEVKTNFQAGKVRLVLVSDEIPVEIRRVIEFLNKQMDPAQVLGVEIKQYLSEDGLKTLVPRLIGQTTESQQRKSSLTRERRRWNEDSFFDEFAARWGEDEAQIAESIHSWAQQNQPDMDIQWGTGDTYGGFTAVFHPKGKHSYQLFTVDIAGRLEISSHHYGAQSPFKDAPKWLELRNKLSSIGLSLPTDPTERRSPNLPLSRLQDDAGLKQVIATFDWIIEMIKS